MSPCPPRLVMVLFAVVASAAAAGAQQPPPIIELSFSNPGARSLGFGGAFVARADDATAAFANPAGLVQLVEPELSVEGRYRDQSTPQSSTAEPSADLTAASFVSFVYPLKRWSIAAYSHGLADITNFSGFPGLDSDRIPLELTLSNYGLSAAFRVTERLSLGLGLAYIDGFLLLTPQESSADGSADSIPLEDADSAFIAGLLWNVSEQWSAGGFYRQGAELELPIAVPGVCGLGFSFRSAGGGLTLSLEWDRIEDANIPVTREYPLPGRAVREGGNEVHLGGEYAWLRSQPVYAVRLGAWMDSKYRIRSTGTAGGTTWTGGGKPHFALGFGVAFRRFQLDVAYDFSDRVDTGSISAIVYF